MHMENKQVTTDLKIGTSSYETLPKEIEKRKATTDKPRGRGRPSKCPRQESPKPEQTGEAIPGGKATEPVAENNGNAKVNLRLSPAAQDSMLSFFTANYSIAALNSAHAACAAARASYGLGASSAPCPILPAANAGSHAACAASAEAEAASIAAAIATSNSRLEYVNSLRMAAPSRTPSSGASSSGSAPLHAD